MSSHKLRFFRAGGFDQARIESGEDLIALLSLDRKLWVALSCPVKGLEFDEKTLQLIDTDHDGHIRAPEIIAAVEWACSVLKEPSVLFSGTGELPLSMINDATEEGKRLLSSARRILLNLGRPESACIAPSDTEDEEKIFGHTALNGDGVICPDSTGDLSIKAVIQDIMACMGTVRDRSGCEGITQETADVFFEEVKAFHEWVRRQYDAPHLLAFQETGEQAYAAWTAVYEKMEDYFCRCRLAALDTRAAAMLNPSDEEYRLLASETLSHSSEKLASFPLAPVLPGGRLPLQVGLNPAWHAPVARFREEFLPQNIGDEAMLTEDEWRRIVACFAPYVGWRNEKPRTSIEILAPDRVSEIAEGKFEEAVADLIAQDKALAEAADAVADVDRLVRYCRDLVTLVNNFVSFRDFYTGRGKAVFQAGVLYLDGRSCELCVRTEAVDKHAAIATLSHICLVYCECTRKGGAERMIISAAMTAGDSDQLRVGRNGLFYDRKGMDWDAAVVKVIDHPIGIRQAFWSPYKKALKMVEEQFAKIAASKSGAVQEKMASGAVGVAGGKEESKTAQAFDVGKFAGIFAAVGLAVGAIGTALAAVVTGLFRLAWWQIPLALLGLTLVVSGPSMAIAWSKLRRRTLGPVLDANGWAINARVKINIPFGAALTGTARLPEGSERSLTDPFAEKNRRWIIYVVLIIAAVAIILKCCFRS